MANMAAKCIGMQVKVKTAGGETIEGEIFTYDANTNCVVLGKKPATPVQRLRLTLALRRGAHPANTEEEHSNHQGL